ncbi:MAG: phage shock protein E [Candidatus Latescibacterota bacterium]
MAFGRGTRAVAVLLKSLKGTVVDRSIALRFVYLELLIMDLRSSLSTHIFGERRMVVSVILALFCFFLLGCAASESTKDGEAVPFGDHVLVIDVRTMDEYNSGHVDGAAHIPYEIIGDKIAALSQDKSRDIVLYCRSGRRSGIAQKTLQDMGYTRVVNAGGIDDYRKKLGQ